MVKCVGLCTHVHVCEHVEARGGHHGSSSTSLCLILLRQYLSATSTRLSAEYAGNYEISEPVISSSNPTVLGLQANVATPGFFK